MSCTRHGCRLTLVASLAGLACAADATIPGLQPQSDTASATAGDTATGDSPSATLVPGVDADQQRASSSAAKSRRKDGWSWIASARIAAGFDSNVAILPDEGGGAVNEDSSFVEGSGEGGGQYNHGRHRIRLMGNLSRSHYFENDDYDLERYGLMATWQHLSKPWLPSVVLSHNHYRIDDTSVLGDTDLTLAMARLHNNRHISIGQLKYNSLDYRVSEDLDADRVEIRLGHWFLFGSAHRRISVQVAWRSNQAESDVESYTAIRPHVAFRWRWEDGLAARRTDIQSRLSWQSEEYDEAAAGSPTEETDILEFTASMRWWWNDQAHLGPRLAYTDRDSNIDSKVYDRTRFSIEAGMEW